MKRNKTDGKQIKCDLPNFQTPKQKMEMGTSYKNSSEHQTNGTKNYEKKITKQRAQQRREKGGDTRKQTRTQTIDAPALRRLNEGGRGEDG
jgi:hypothetical protein